MAWRIDTHLVRGEIDNRTRGRIVGRLWFLGREDPVELELQGNPSRDIAGRRLQFVNPSPQPGLAALFSSRQVGVVGDFTASRKVRVPEIPVEQLGEYYGQHKPFPWHWGNSVYFEWFSGANGRVVIESAEYQLTLLPDVAWEMSAEEEEQQRQLNADATEQFFRKLGLLSSESAGMVPPAESMEDDATGFDAAADEDEDLDEEDAAESWRGEGPLTEEEADELIADSDQLTDRLLARLDEAGDGADLEAILEEELERRREETDQRPLSPEEEAQRAAWIDEINRAAEEIAKDPSFQAELARRHPLSERARDFALRLMADADRGNWAPLNAQPEHPVVDLIRSVTKAGGKLAGALDGRHWPPTVEECGVCIAWLKRARGYLEDAGLAADFCREQGLADATAMSRVIQDVARLGDDVSSLIEELRERLNRGFD